MRGRKGETKATPDSGDGLFGTKGTRGRQPASQPASHRHERENVVTEMQGGKDERTLQGDEIWNRSRGDA